jgi:predicted nuclease of predicted toxin-antitoxin system
MADEHIPDQVTFRLRRLGHDVVRVRDFSESKSGDGHEDFDVLAMATLQNRVVVTENWTDFLRLHRDNPGHKGIIGTNQFHDCTAQAKQIDAAIRAELRKHGKLDGRFIRIPYFEDDESRPEPLKKSSR